VAGFEMAERPIRARRRIAQRKKSLQDRWRRNRRIGRRGRDGVGGGERRDRSDQHATAEPALHASGRSKCRARGGGTLGGRLKRLSQRRSAKASAGRQTLA